MNVCMSTANNQHAHQLVELSGIQRNGIPQHHNHFYGPFSGTTRVSRCQKRTSDFMVQGKINRGRHTDHPAVRLSIWT